MQINSVGVAVTGNVDVVGIVNAQSLITRRPDGGCVYFGLDADNVYAYWNKTSLILRAPSWLFVRSSDNGTIASIDGNGNYYGAGAVLSGNINLTPTGENDIIFGATGGGYLYGNNTNFGFYKPGGGHIMFAHATGNITTAGNLALTTNPATILLGPGPIARITGAGTTLTLRANAHHWENETAGASMMDLTPSGLSVYAPIATNNIIYIQSASPTQWWQDSDGRSFGIHVNGNLAYFMRGDVNGSTWTALANGEWPMYMNLDTGDIRYGGNITVVGNIIATDIKAQRPDHTGVVYLGDSGQTYIYGASTLAYRGPSHTWQKADGGNIATMDATGLFRAGNSRAAPASAVALKSSWPPPRPLLAKATTATSGYSTYDAPGQSRRDMARCQYVRQGWRDMAQYGDGVHQGRRHLAQVHRPDQGRGGGGECRW
jgi:hypothetical protein